MRKRTLCLALAICLAACLLPVSADTVSASVTLTGSILTVSGYDSPAYFANTEAEQANTKAPDADNWNAKLVWNSGEEMPTLYLDGFVADEYDAETKKWQETSTTAIAIPAGQPTRIVITGEDSRIRTPFGIAYQSPLELVSEGDAKLRIWNRYTAITSGAATGCSLTINADLDLFVQTYYDASSHILQTNQADLTVNGGKIKISTDDEKSLFGIITRNAGNIIINGGELDVTSSIGAAPANGSVHASGRLIIGGGAVKATAKSSVPLYARGGIEINGGAVDISGPYYGINAGTPEAPADIAIKGGTVRIAANRAFFTYPVLGEGVFAYAGANEASAEAYDGTRTALAKEPWMLISNDPGLQKTTAPTQAPTEPAEPATAKPTAAPTEAPATTHPTVAPTQPPTEAPGADVKAVTVPRILLWLATAAAMGLAGIIITLIAFRRKNNR